MARDGGVRGWHSMRKDELIKALLTAARANAKSRPAKNGVAPHLNGSSKRGVTNGIAKPANPRVIKHLEQIKAKLEQSKNLAHACSTSTKKRLTRDRVIVMVRDSFWLHVYWELLPQSVDRARAAMGEHWHLAKPCLRLMEVIDGGTTISSERVVEDVVIHGGVSNWYLHVKEPPRSYRVEIGYLAANGKFLSLARSNVVTTPVPGTSDPVDEHWAGVAEDFDKIYAMSGGYSLEGSSMELQELFEERLRRPMGSPMMTRYGDGIDGMFPTKGNFKLDVDAEMILFGSADPSAHLCIRGEPVKLRPDGSFTLRVSLPNQRQVIPVVASAANGGEQRTIVLAVERNTKVMEPVTREAND
jgi:hypothetical protein